MPTPSQHAPYVELAGLALATGFVLCVLATTGRLAPAGAQGAFLVAGFLLAGALVSGLRGLRLKRLLAMTDEARAASLQGSTAWVPAQLLAGSGPAPSDHDADGQAELREQIVSAMNDTTAAMMLADRDFHITYINPSTMKLLRDNADEIRMTVPKFDPDNLLGQPMDIFHSGGNKARKHLANPANLPFKSDIKVGPLWFALTIASARNGNGEHAGFVLEWAEVTELRRNRVIRETLEEGQILCEFTPDGEVMTVNDNFIEVTGHTRDALKTLGYVDLVTSDGTRPKTDWTDICSGDPSIGRIVMRAASGDLRYFNGGFTPVRDSSGSIMSVLMIGNDTTAAVHLRMRTDAEREVSRAEVQNVVDSLGSALSALSAGDLAAELRSPFAEGYEPIRVSFNAAIKDLGNAIETVMGTIASLREKTGSVSESTLSLAKTTEKQASSLEETAAALDQMTASVKSASASAEDAKKHVEKTRDSAVASGEVVNDAIEAMKSIEESSEKIAKITDVIDSISFQTNLLALNAGVEAARAGEAGRGFSVVASEVRALAQRSAQSATEIRQLINDSSQSVERGSGLVSKAGEALQAIIEGMADVDAKVGEIAQSSAEQAVGLGDINQAVNSLGSANQTFAAAFEETTAATQAIERDVQNLGDRVAHFRTSEGKGSATPQAMPAAQPRPEPKEKAASQSAAKSVSAQATDGNLALKSSGGGDGWEDF
ncbi:PAS domain-containing methyl-accepting chemotaxis protein [Sulfitobacter sp. LCG007]